ncbi:MAG: hypothetical protein AAF289_20390 [Cyanobacteria bacterium P01_A01_bin.135]
MEDFQPYAIEELPSEETDYELPAELYLKETPHIGETFIYSSTTYRVEAVIYRAFDELNDAVKPHRTKTILRVRLHDELAKSSSP